MTDRKLTVTQLTDYINGLLIHDPILRRVQVEGEVSNFRRVASGHCYFSLGDAGASIRCVLFAQYAGDVEALPENGTTVVCQGNIAMYVEQGDCQLYVQRVERSGEGEAAREFELLRAELAALGYFDEMRKRPLPPYASTIGVVTSSSGAVLHDIIHVISRRFPAVKLVLYSANVQGTEAPTAIARGIGALSGQPDIDVIIVARGGGSAEDLSAFNARTVVEAIYASRCPVISAVGHQTDFTLADFVADLRAPTPSAAAEMAVPDMQSVKNVLHMLTWRGAQALERTLLYKRRELDVQQRTLSLLHPRARILAQRGELTLLEKQLRYAYERAVQAKGLRLSAAEYGLQGSSPLAILQKGYAIALKDGAVAGYDDLQSGDTLTIRLLGGDVRAVVGEKTKTGEEKA